MSDIIDFEKYKNRTVVGNIEVNLIEMGTAYDDISLKYLNQGVDIKDVAGIMANRLGELVRIFGGDKELLKGMLYNIIHDRAYLGEER